MNYQKLREIIIKANPEKFNKAGFRRYDNISRPIRLADVLLATEKLDSLYYFEGRKVEKSCSPKNYPISGMEQIINKWNLKDNNLDNQSDETKKFLIKLLVIKQ